MRHRLGVADILIKQPRVVIMDEPTQGLDPELARGFLKLIRELADSGITILLSSHLLPQVQEVCDRVGLFHRGRMVLEGTVPELGRQVLGAGYHIHLQANGSAGPYLDALRGLPDIIEVAFEAPDRYTLVAARDLRADAARVVVEAGGDLTALSIESLSLDDIYNAYFEEVNHGPRD
jgi:ABC-2 type transport system ATP-binding protein